MRKIPTLFVRDPGDLRHVLPEVTPGCEWVLAGEGVARRQYDGTCVMVDEDGDWWARREVKPGKTPPPGWKEIERDPVTGKSVGWEPAEQTGWWKWLQRDHDSEDLFQPGTYEACGPKINGNPEGFGQHTLIRHADAQQLHAVDRALTLAAGAPVIEIRDFLAILLTTLHGPGGRVPAFEGIVWHHPDGRMAKLKARDFK
ncbi:MAG TPA: hypothetical protein VFM55_19265 [Micromonosporaceae bacterium]|nr:hypothetical protein [Micromonosporaceae bacterium]